jgi:DNA-binding transcriptional MerR regulator
MEKLCSAGEIVKKLKGVTTRQILDLAEKGLITPFRETTGAGSPRLYDFRNIFEICLCLAVRGRIPAGTATQELIANILQFVREETRKQEKENEKGLDILELLELKMIHRPEFPEPPPFDILHVAYDDSDNYSFIPISFDQEIGDVLAKSKKYRPQNFCTYVIEVKRLWEYLEGIF